MTASKTWYRHRPQNRNLQLVRKNWSAIRTYLELTYGFFDSRSNFYGPHNRKVLQKMMRVVKKLVYGGFQQGVKDLSSLSRRKAICDDGKTHLRNRGKTVFANFLASTLARGCVGIKNSKLQIEEEVKAACARLSEKTPMPDRQLLDRLDQFIDLCLEGVKRNEKTQLPLPGTSACYEQGQKLGGATWILKSKHATKSAVLDEAEQMANEIALIEQFNEGSSNWYQASSNDLEEMLTFSDTRDFAFETYNFDFQAKQKDRTIPELFIESTFEANWERKARLTPVEMPDGKIRVLTVHTASVVWAARAMTSFLMPVLKKLSFSRQMLRNERVHIYNPQKGRKVIYSADLSKSTDPISIELSRYVLERIAAKLGKPDWWSNALRAVINEHEIESKIVPTFKSQCGALMGLGPGWVTLTVLNSFAAWNAGAPISSFSTCGDDLIGLWTPKVCDAYAETLVALGLVPNHDKSYRSAKYGVFCERLIVRESEHVATGRPCTRIGEAVGARAIEGQHGMAVIDNMLELIVNDGNKVMKSPKPIVRALTRTAKFTRLSSTPGSLKQGGGGNSTPASAVTFVSYLMGGPTQISKSTTNKKYTELRNGLREVPRAAGGVRADEVLIKAKAEIELSYRIEHKMPSEAPTFLERSAIRKEIQRREARSKFLLRNHKGPLKVIRVMHSAKATYARLDSKTVKQVSHLVRHRRYGDAIKNLRRSWEATIDRDIAQAVYVSTIDSSADESHRVNLFTLQPTPAMWDSSTGR